MSWEHRLEGLQKCTFCLGMGSDSGSITRFVLLVLLLSPSMLFNRISTVSLVIVCVHV